MDGAVFVGYGVMHCRVAVRRDLRGDRVAACRRVQNVSAGERTVKARRASVRVPGLELVVGSY